MRPPKFLMRIFSLRYPYIGIVLFFLIAAHGKNQGGGAVKFKCVVHKHVRTTVFWVGEPGSADNAYIPNDQSTWDGSWKKHYGGFDDPNNRNGYWPDGFTPHENPFYCALPYSDLDSDGNRKNSSTTVVCWSAAGTKMHESLCKNHWVRILFKGKNCYAQWEDAGPFGENDSAYVFGSHGPQQHAGLDVSPAVRDFLGLNGLNFTEWEFVDSLEVPAGPWRRIITRSGVSK